MPEPQVVPTAPAVPVATAIDSYGDIPFDDLFAGPSDGGTVTDPATPPAPSATPQVPAALSTPAEPFLKAGKTVYKSREEAERSLEYKDQVIENLRQIEIRRTGIDPLTQKVVPPTPQGPVNYKQNQAKYLEDLVDAVTKQDATRYFDAQQKMVYDVLEPIAPIIAEFARSRAIGAVSQEIKNFDSFHSGQEYKDTLDALPELKAAIEYAERDVSMNERLPQLYKTAYWATQGRKTPEIVQSAVQAATPPPTPARPTTAPGNLAPPTSPSAPLSLATSEGRKAIMASLEGRIQDAKW